jgi:hypothetical protein
MIDNTDEKDIELMFAEARRYDLLTAEQEQQIDAAKWQAVRELYALIANEEELSDYLATFCDQCLVNPPQIQRFPNRDLHFVLRRELAALFTDGSHSAQSREAAQKLGTLKTPSARVKYVEALELPASLTVGIAVADTTTSRADSLPIRCLMLSAIGSDTGRPLSPLLHWSRKH